MSSADEECYKFTNSKYLSTLLKIQEDSKADIEQLVATMESMKVGKQVHDMLEWVSTSEVGPQHFSVKEKLGSDYSQSGKWLLDHKEFIARWGRVLRKRSQSSTKN
jgi:hypothetical protein